MNSYHQEKECQKNEISLLDKLRPSKDTQFAISVFTFIVLCVIVMWGIVVLVDKIIKYNNMILDYILLSCALLIWVWLLITKPKGVLK